MTKRPTIQRLLYVSDATQVLNPEDVARIADRASRNNREQAITGALAFNGQNFCQVIEGDPQTVLQLMEKISADPRHDNIITLSSKQVTRRRYPGWYMKHVEALNFDELIEAMAG